MASLTLEEAAEKAGTSKVDIWRAIREGGLTARRTAAGGFAIDPEELFRVFAARAPSVAEEPATATAGIINEPERGEPAERAATKDIETEFAALGAELKALLGLPPSAASSEAGPGDGVDGRDDGEERQETELVERNAQLEAELAAVRTIAEKAMAEFATLSQRLEANEDSRRPWWRRITG